MIILFIVDEVRVSRNVEARSHQGLSVDLTLSILKDLFDKLAFRLDQVEAGQDERDGCEKLQFHDSWEKRWSNFFESLSFILTSSQFRNKRC